jgi:uncharacterized membrane protein YfcA
MSELQSLFDPGFALALGVAVVAGLMRGFAGFGSGMLMAPIFALLFGPVETVVIVIVMELVVTAQLLPGLRRTVDWRLVGAMGAVAALFMPLGSWLLVSVDATLMTRAIALVVLGFVALLASGWSYHGARRLPVTLGIGALSGTMMAATSLGNPPVMLYLLAGRDPAAVSRANVTAYFAITLTCLIALMLASGLIAVSATWTAAALLPPYMLAAWAGSRLFRASGEALYRRVALAFLAAAGLIGLFG